MAGGKETPRQKMIGMMYLVLTALLALQVSAAIIQKFEFLDNSLSAVNKKTINENVDIRDRIHKTVEEEGGKDSAIVKQANLVREKTSDLLNYMNTLRSDLINKCGGLDENGKYNKPKDEDGVGSFMIGAEGSKKGSGYELQKKLNQYADEIRSMKLDEVKVPAKLAMDGSEDPMFKDDPDQKSKDFAQLNFAQTPLVAALAVLSEKQSKVLKLETEALNALALKVGATDLKFDNIRVVVSPKSSVVASGAKFEADMFLAASSSAITPEMSANGANVKVENGIGKVSFPAKATKFDKDGRAKKVMKAAISFKHKGKDTTFTKDFEYHVSKPVIQVQAAAVSALYRNCANELNVMVPALGSSYDPKFTASGAKVMQGRGGAVTLVPTGRTVKLNVSSGGNYIGSEEFQVKGVPRPDIKAYVGTKPANEKQGEPANGVRSLTMRAEAEENFKQMLPKEAKYKVVQWECLLVRGKRPVGRKMVSGPTANLADFAAQAKGGDRILIDVKKVLRYPSTGGTENVNVGTVIKNIPLN